MKNHRDKRRRLESVIQHDLADVVAAQEDGYFLYGSQMIDSLMNTTISIRHTMQFLNTLPLLARIRAKRAHKGRS